MRLDTVPDHAYNKEIWVGSNETHVDGLQSRCTRQLTLADIMTLLFENVCRLFHGLFDFIFRQIWLDLESTVRHGNTPSEG